MTNEYRMETPFKIGKSKVYKIFDIDGKDMGYRRRLTNKEIRQKKLGKDSIWVVVNDWELR